jgi:hypothetical protein
VGRVSEIWFPSTCGMVTSRISHYPHDDSSQATIIYVDEGHVGAWRQDPWNSDLLRRMHLGERVWVVENGKYRELELVAAPAPEIAAGIQALLKLVVAEAAEAVEASH